MNILDWVLVAVVAAYALSGYWQGFITGLCATFGLVLGGLLGVWLAPKIFGNAGPSVWVTLGALLVLLAAASVGQAVFQILGAQARDKISWQPARILDALGGAVLGVVAVLFVSWILGLALTGAKLPGVSAQVRNSVLLRSVDQVVPHQARDLLRKFNNLVSAGDFPRYLEPFAPEQIVQVKPAPKSVLNDPEVQAAAASVFKVRSFNQCGDGVEGTGFLVAPERLITNAHVIAAVREPKVLVKDQPVAAQVVFFDPELDLAVLAVPGLTGPVLKFDLTGERGVVGAALGFPNDGPYQVRSMRIRTRQQLRSPDIYNAGSVTREVFALRGNVESGSSGGPLVDLDGRVLGVVFAASLSDKETGYALTASQIASAVTKGVAARTPVGTGTECG